tara:strand:- start:292 stop:582 length:291 start_codon:yes stop_codon:yes gene_type:complete
MNSKIKKIIIEEVEKLFLGNLNEQIDNSQMKQIIAKVKQTDSKTRSGETLAGADDDVIKLVANIQAAAGLKGDDVDGIYGPQTHAAIIKAQGVYKG